MNPFDLAQEAVDIDRSLEEVSPVYAQLAALADEARDGRQPKSHKSIDDMAERAREREQLEARVVEYRQKTEGALSNSAPFKSKSVALGALKIAGDAELISSVEQTFRSPFSGAASDHLGAIAVEKARIGDVQGAVAIIHELGTENASIVNACSAIHKIDPTVGMIDIVRELIRNTDPEVHDVDDQRMELAIMLAQSQRKDEAVAIAEMIEDQDWKKIAYWSTAECTGDTALLQTAMNLTDYENEGIEDAVEHTLIAARLGSIEVVNELLDLFDDQDDRLIIAARVYAQQPVVECKNILIEQMVDRSGATTLPADFVRITVCEALVQGGDEQMARDQADMITVPYYKIRALLALSSFQHDTALADKMFELYISEGMSKALDDKLTSLSRIIQANPDPTTIERVRHSLPTNSYDLESRMRELAVVIAQAGDIQKAEEIISILTDKAEQALGYAALLVLAKKESAEYGPEELPA